MNPASPSHDHAAVRRIRAVVVDDQRDQRQMVEFMLIAKGFDVAGTADNGDEALDVIRSVAADIVVSDYQMAGATGLDMVRSLRRTPGFEHLPVVIVTGSDDAGVAELRRTDHVVVLAKPVAVLDLTDAVEALLIAAAEREPELELVGRATSRH